MLTPKGLRASGNGGVPSLDLVLLNAFGHYQERNIGKGQGVSLRHPSDAVSTLSVLAAAAGREAIVRPLGASGRRRALQTPGELPATVYSPESGERAGPAAPQGRLRAGRGDRLMARCWLAAAPCSPPPLGQWEACQPGKPSHGAGAVHVDSTDTGIRRSGRANRSATPSRSTSPSQNLRDRAGGVVFPYGE